MYRGKVFIGSGLVLEVFFHFIVPFKPKTIVCYREHDMDELRFTVELVVDIN